MKNKAIELLKTKFPGVSNSIIEKIAARIVEKKGAETEDAVATAVEETTFQTVLDAYGDARATEAAESRIANYEKKYGLKDGKAIEAPKPAEPPKGDGKDDDQPAWAKKLQEQNEALQKRIAEMDGAAISKIRKNQLAAALEKAPEKLKARYQKDLDRMTFADDAEYQAWMTEVKTDTEAMVAEAAVKGVVFSKPPSGGTGGTDKVSPEVEARIKAREAETVAPAIAGLPVK